MLHWWVQRRMILDNNLHRDPEAAECGVREIVELKHVNKYNKITKKLKLASHDDANEMVNRLLILHLVCLSSMFYFS